MSSSWSKIPPTPIQLENAAKQVVHNAEGQKVELGSIWKGEGQPKKTIILFIRHFYCGLCMDFLSFLSTRVSTELLEAHKVSLVVIGCGDWALIKPYAELLKIPYPMYADPRKVSYNALGMNLRSLVQGDKAAEYVVRSLFANIILSIKSAFKMGKIFSSSSGDIKQLGGEFVFEDTEAGIQVLYTNRMENTMGHGPIAEFLAAAGIELPAQED